MTDFTKSSIKPLPLWRLILLSVVLLFLARLPVATVSLGSTEPMPSESTSPFTDTSTQAEELSKLFQQPNRAPATDVPFPTKHTVDENFWGATSTHAADVDSDGDLDILGAARDIGDITWWENTAGDGTTWSEHTVDDAFEGRDVYAADVDGDGDMDILGASFNNDDITWWENSAGDGSAWTEHTVDGDFNGAISVYAADMDGDGDLDVLGAGFNTQTITWWQNTAGDGTTWSEHTVQGSFSGAYSVYAADIDGDGDMDILGTAAVGDQIAWWVNTAGDGSSWSRRTLNGSFNGAQDIYAADLDRDGDLDIMGTAHYEDDIRWWENTVGDGSNFSEHIVTENFDGAAEVVATDIDLDGDLDLLGIAFAANAITWWENTSSSKMAPGNGITWLEHPVDGEFDDAFSVYAADIDGDGDQDILGAARDVNEIAWWENETIHRNALYPLQAEITDLADGARSVHAVDVDKDGDMDVLSASRSDNKIAWYQNDGNSPPSFTSAAIATNVDGAFSVYATDVNDDGHMDVLSASVGDHNITWYENDGTSPPAFTSHVITTTANLAWSVYAADVDSDGDMDVLSASHGDDKIAWYENDGTSSPSFTDHVITTTADGATSVYAADVDSDGDMDVLSASFNDDQIAWYENDGTSPPAFTDHVITTTANGATSVYATDMDGDGDVDVLSTSSGDDRVTWYENEGGLPPTFTEHVIATTADDARSVYAQDMDSDGDIDVLSASYADDKITWYENEGTTFTSHVITSTADGAYSVYAADVDSDGDLDVLSASDLDDKIAWYENRGGQFGLNTTDTAPATIESGTQDDLLAIVATHHGRNGDHDAELVTFELLFEETADDPLTTGEANALIQNLHIYLDDGSGTFEAGSDTLVTTVETLALSSGIQPVPFTDADSNVQFQYGTPRTYFVVAQLTADAHTQTPNSFRLTHISQASSTAEDREFDIPLILQYAANLSSNITTAIGPATPTATHTATPSHTLTPTNTPTDTPTNTPPPTITPGGPTVTPSHTPSATHSPTETATATRTNTPAATNSPTLTPSHTPSATHSPTQTPTATRTNTPTATNSPTVTSSHTPSPTHTSTKTPMATHTIPPKATITPTPPTLTPSNTQEPGTGDAYEIDDSCVQASSIATDGSQQVHTFHDEADSDWIAFQATEAITYVIEVQVPFTSLADVVLEVYQACDSGGSFENSNPPVNPDIRLTFAPPSSGTYYLHLYNDSARTGSSAAYHLSIRALQDTISSDAVILVAGRLRANDPLQENIHDVTNRLYQFARTHGCTTDQIAYLATDTTLEGVTGRPTFDNLQEAITEWAVERVGTNGTLSIYMMDHGNYDLLYLDDTEGEQITPLDLDEWLDQLELAVPDIKVNVIVEACYSGSFIDPNKSLSGPGRVIISSTSQNALAYASQEGATFSDTFLGGLAQGRSLYSAFSEGKWAATQGHPDQQAWLDDNGDAAYTPADGLLAAQRSLSCAPIAPEQNFPPNVQEIEVRDISGSQGEIWAKVLDDNQVMWAWAIVYPPSYQPPQSGNEMVAEPVSVALPNRGDGWYATTYGEFDELGEYRVVIYGADHDGLQSRPQEMLLQTGYELYLPAITR